MLRTAVACLALVLPAVAHATCDTPSALDTAFTGAAVGDVISLSGVNPLSCPEIAMYETWGGGKLIFSDSPESPTAKAKLYMDTGLAATSGSNYNRVYLYHVNGKASGKARFTVVLKNTSGSSGTLTVQKKGTAGPTTSFAYAGKLAVQRYIDSVASGGVSVAAGAYQRLDTTFDATDVSVGNLLHGIWDYSFTQTHEIHICMLDTGDAPTSVCPGLSVAARDSHDRGTFDYSDKVYDTDSDTVTTAEGCQSFPVGGGTADDANASGYDNAVSPPTSEVITGNYGVLYRMHIATSGDGSAYLGYCINPRGGAFGSAMRIMAGVLPASNTTALLPSGSGTSSDNTKCTVVGRYQPSAGGLTVWGQFMPAGGTSLPLRFVWVPH